MYKENKKVFIKNKSYLIGFILSFLLTIISFLSALIVKTEFYFLENFFFIKILIFVCALLQIFIHLIYFLNINTNNNDNIWLLFTLIFTIIIISIILIGSIWIIFNLNKNM